MSLKCEQYKVKADLSTGDIQIFEAKTPPAPECSQLVWAEVNILSLPFACLDERESRTSEGHEIIKFDSANGKQIVWLWRVWPDPKVGMPTMATLHVLFALLELAEEQNYPYRLEFSLGDVCRRLGFTSDGRHRAMIKKHIEILLSTQCKSKGAFKDKEKNGLYLETFRYIRQAGFVGDRDEHGNELEKNFVVFDDPIRINLEAKYVKQIDVALMRQIKSPIGQLLYTKISYGLHEMKRKGLSHTEWDYPYLAERMGITVYDQPSKAKKQLKQAISELVALHYIKKPKWNGMTIKFEAGVRYQFGEDAPRTERKRAARISQSRNGNPISTVLLTEEHDPLIPLGTLYVAGGWKLAEPQAKLRGITEEQLRAECIRMKLLQI